MLKFTTGSISNCFTLTTAGGQFESLQGVDEQILPGIGSSSGKDGDIRYIFSVQPEVRIPWK